MFIQGLSLNVKYSEIPQYRPIISLYFQYKEQSYSNIR